MTLNQSDIATMRYLLDNEHILANNVVTVDDVATRNKDELSKATLYKVFKKLEELGYVKQGVRRGNSKTFFITLDGANAVKELVSTPIEIKEELVRAYNDITINKDKQPSWHDMFEEVAEKQGYKEETEEN